MTNTNTTLNVKKGGDNEIDAVLSKYFSALKARSVIDSPDIYTESPNLYSVPPILQMDYSKILNKPFHLANYSWNTAQVPFQLIRLIKFPSEIIASNALVKVPFASSVLFRAKACVIAQVAGTPMHQGSIVVSALPMGTPPATSQLYQNHFMAPHAIMSANAATSACVEIPFYVNTKLSYCDVDHTTIGLSTFGLDYAQISTIVLNQLACPSGASTAISISYHFMFKEIEFYVPHSDIPWGPPPAFAAEATIVNSLRGMASDALDTMANGARNLASDFIDVGRGLITQYTGLHNPNYPVVEHKVVTRYTNQHNSVDCQTKYEKLDPYSGFIRTTNDYTFDTSVDEMDILYHLMKPAYVGSFSVRAADTVGTLCWSRPISPFQTANILGASIIMGTHLERFALLSKFWKGSMKIHIHSSMSNFHFCKLSVTRNYSPVKDSLTKIPQYASLSNLMVDSLEFSAGGQVHTVELPYVSPFNEVSTVLDWKMIATQLGVYYIHVQSPLVINGSVPNDVKFNVFISACDDFQFYGHSVYPIESDVRAGAPPLFIAEAQPAERASDQTEIEIQRNEYTGIYLDASDHRPVTSVRDMARRMTQVYSSFLTGDEIASTLGVKTLDVGRLVGLNAPYGDLYTPGNLNMLNRMFYGYDGGFRFKIVIHGALDAKVYYVPPGTGYDATSNTLVALTPAPVSGPNALPSTLRFASRCLMADEYSRWRPLTVYTETSNKWQSYPGHCMIHKLGERYRDQPLATRSIVEFEIPAPANLRFAGSMLNNYLLPDPTVVDWFDDINVALGHLVIALGYMGTIREHDEEPPNITPVEIQVFAAASDEGRFGYGVLSPGIIVPSYGEDTGGAIVQDGPYFYHDPTGVISGLIINPRTVIPGAFYTKTT